MSGTRRLSFLVAGVQKGGTSALHDYLREVPGLQLPVAKELHFFDDEEGVDWRAPDYRPLHDQFVEDGRLWGEATPITLYWPQALERVRAYNPDMRLVLVFRDPVERAWSQWRMEYAKGKERLPFADAIRGGRARMAAAAPFPGHHRVFSYVERGYYGRQMARAIGLFGRERLLPLRSVDLAADPAGTIGRVCRFLGVTPPPQPLHPRRVREAAAIPYPSRLEVEDVAFLQRLYAADQARFALLTSLGNLSDGPRWAGNRN